MVEEAAASLSGGGGTVYPRHMRCHPLTLTAPRARRHAVHTSQQCAPCLPRASLARPPRVPLAPRLPRRSSSYFPRFHCPHRLRTPDVYVLPPLVCPPAERAPRSLNVAALHRSAPPPAHLPPSHRSCLFSSVPLTVLLLHLRRVPLPPSPPLCPSSPPASSSSASRPSSLPACAAIRAAPQLPARGTHTLLLY